MPEDKLEDPQSTLAASTLARIKAGIDEGHTPVISQVVQLIREMSEKAEDMSVQDLANIVSQDPSTMNRILSIAATMGYNPTGAEITSILQAISLIGFERIRNLAISVLLLENVEQQNNLETNRELAGLSLTSGLLASELCAKSRAAEPDLAFLCGALRSYGRMLMATFMAEEFAQACDAITSGTTSDEAYRQRFGLTPLDLGKALLAGMQLPPLILKTLQEIPDSTRARLAESPTGSLMLAADLGLKLADVLASQTLEPETFAKRLSDVTQSYPDSFKLTSKDIGDIIKEASSKMNTFRKTGREATGRVVLFERLECLAEGRMPPPPFKRKTKKPPTPTATGRFGESAGSGGGSLSIAEQSALLNATIEELSQLVISPRPDLERVFSLLIQTFQNAFNLQSCLIFTRNADGKSFNLLKGVGPLLPQLPSPLTIYAGQRDVFGLPLARGEDVLIQNPDEARMRAFVPEWLRKPGQCLPFMLIPFKDSVGTFSLICGVCRTNTSLALVGQSAKELRQISGALAKLGPLLRAQQP